MHEGKRSDAGVVGEGKLRPLFARRLATRDEGGQIGGGEVLADGNETRYFLPGTPRVEAGERGAATDALKGVSVVGVVGEVDDAFATVDGRR